MSLLDSHAELLRFAIADRDAFYDGCSLEDGTVPNRDDQAELDRLDAIIDRAHQAIQEHQSTLLNAMAKRVVNMCHHRNWSMHWTHRGAYLHLESSELIEAIRGKHGIPVDEAGDVLLVLMSIVEYAGIPFSDVIAAAAKKLSHLETAPPYAGEERER